MATTLTAFDLPLRLDARGTIRVGRSRVTLDTVIDAYHRGASPEAIARQFPAVTLADVYGAIANYLQHQVEMDAYLRARGGRRAARPGSRRSRQSGRAARAPAGAPGGSAAA